MDRFRIRHTISMIIIIAILLPSCGMWGDESEVSQQTGAVSQPSETVTALEWDPPEVADDGTPMDPRQDLEYYELYLRTDTNFGDHDLPVAYVASFTDVFSPDGESFKRELVNEFFLDNLLPFTEGGKPYYVSLRAVSVDGKKSEFMYPVVWDLS